MEGDRDHKTPGNFVRLSITPSLSRLLDDPLRLKRINTRRPSTFSNEDYFIFSEAANSIDDLEGFAYLGSHVSDSGLTCIVNEDSFVQSPMSSHVGDAALSAVDDHPQLEKEDDDSMELDWLELVTATLDQPGEPLWDLESYPILKFCAPIPEEDSCIAVFGKPSKEDSSVYDQVILRAWCKAFSEEAKEEIFGTPSTADG